MNRAVALIAGIILFTGCASDPRGVKLSDVDLSDMRTVQEVRAQLNAEDGVAFANYVVKHHIASANFCGRTLARSDGKPPETIGEAIDLALAREAEDRRAFEIASKPKHPRELAQQHWDDLISERDFLIDAKSMMRGKHGTAAERQSEWSSIETQLADVDRRLVEIKPRVFGSHD